MATVFQQSAGQPMFAPPGVAPQVVNAQMPAMAPGSVLYYPQMAGSGGALIMVRVFHRSAYTDILHNVIAYADCCCDQTT